LGAIRLEIVIEGVNATVKLPALLDTGARRNFIRRVLSTGDTVDSIGISEFRGKQAAWLADSTRVDGDSVAFPSMTVLKRRTLQAPFVVLGDLKEEAIIGHLTMQALDLHLRPHAEEAWPHYK
jgi:hypothetical protein